ncbi:MAG: type I-E CRISPR-associated protein Cas7/Cse4/CasC, partial [Chloroflexota bacterium]
LAQPTGKQNSFAAQNLPDFVLVEVSQKNIPVNHANAFLKPIGKSIDSLMEKSIEKFNDTSAKVRSVYGLNGQRAYISIPDQSIEDAENVGSLHALQQWASQKIGEIANG